MRRLAVLAGAVALSVVLSGCGSPGYSYVAGYHEGQSLAANVPHGSLGTTEAASVCRHDWLIAGSVIVSRAPWLHGCVTGFGAVAKVVGRP